MHIFTCHCIHLDAIFQPTQDMFSYERVSHYWPVTKTLHYGTMVKIFFFMVKMVLMSRRHSRVEMSPWWISQTLIGCWLLVTDTHWSSGFMTWEDEQKKKKDEHKHSTHPHPRLATYRCVLWFLTRFCIQIHRFRSGCSGLFLTLFGTGLKIYVKWRGVFATTPF